MRRMVRRMVKSSSKALYGKARIQILDMRYFDDSSTLVRQFCDHIVRGRYRHCGGTASMQLLI